MKRYLCLTTNQYAPLEDLQFDNIVEAESPEEAAKLFVTEILDNGCDVEEKLKNWEFDDTSGWFDGQEECFAVKEINFL